MSHAKRRTHRVFTKKVPLPLLSHAIGESRRFLKRRTYKRFGVRKRKKPRETGLCAAVTSGPYRNYYDLKVRQYPPVGAATRALFIIFFFSSYYTQSINIFVKHLWRINSKSFIYQVIAIWVYVRWAECDATETERFHS